MTTARINSRPVEINEGETILDAATRLGIEIPTLCHAEGLVPQGSCRLCVVHSENHDHPLAACHTPLTAGMELQTHHVKVEKWRNSLLRLFGETTGDTGFRPTKVRDGNFDRWCNHYQIDYPASAPPVGTLSDDSHPLFRFDQSLCLTCGLCVTACGDLACQSVWEIHGRGASIRIQPSDGLPLTDTTCTACGACIDHCPTGALREKKGHGPTAESPQATGSVCGVCSVGCRIEIETADEDIRRIFGPPQSATNPAGLLCQKGKFSFGFNGRWDRLTKPMLRLGAGFREVSWGEAFQFIESALIRIVNAHGPGAFAAVASPRASTESNYLLQKFCRSVVGSPHVDSTARFDHAATLTALRQFFGVGAATASFADIDDATCLVIAGADPDASHPVLASLIRQSVARGAALIVIDPRRTALAAQADLHLAVPPGEDLALFEAVAFRLTQQAPHQTPPTDAGRLGAALLRHRGSTVFLPGTGLAEVATIGTFLRLAHLTDNLGRKGAGVLPFGGQNNLQGCWDAGAAPELLPGQRDISDAEARARIEDLWGRCLPEERGFTLPEMISAIQEKSLRAMWVLGNDPSQRLGGDTLKPLDLLVVQDLFYSETSRHAHVLLPAASGFEQSGVFINAERRAQLIRPALPPSEEARPDWAILTVMARRLGAEWPYLDAAQVFAELSLVAPDLFAGITHRRLEESSDGLQWPCPDEDHPGTRTLPIDSR